MTDETKPPAEYGTNGPDVEACIQEAIESLTRRPERNPETGRFAPSNTAAGKSLEHSAQLWTALAGAKRELRERVTVDRGGSGLAETLTGTIDAYCEARLLRQSLFLRLSDSGGPISTKGRTRALFTAYLAALDRETRLAQVIGLTRQERDISPAEWLAAAERQPREQE